MLPGKMLVLPAGAVCGAIQIFVATILVIAIVTTDNEKIGWLKMGWETGMFVNSRRDYG